MAANSAGILLYRVVDEVVEVLLVHPGGPFWAKKDLGVWTVPKGEIEDGEEARECALRELEEELGSPFDLMPEELIELGSVRQKSGKVVHCWAAEGDFDTSTLCSNTFSMEWPPRSGTEREFPEVDRAEWLGIAEAREKVIPAQAEFLDRLQVR